MSDPIDLRGGRVRGRTVPSYADVQEVMIATNSRGDALVSQALPERTDLARLGRTFGAAIPTASAFTYVNAWPTTRAELVLWNGDAQRHYIIDRAWLYNITSIAAAQPITLIAQIAHASLGIAAPTDNTGVLRYCTFGRSTSTDTAARLMLANTAFALTNKWFVLASMDLSPTTNLSAAVSAECRGRYVIPPGGAFCLAGVSGTAAGTAIIGVEWSEVDLTTV